MAASSSSSTQQRKWINPSQVMNMRKVKKKRRSDEDLLALKENSCRTQEETEKKVCEVSSRAFVGRVTKRVGSSPLVKRPHLSEITTNYFLPDNVCQSNTPAPSDTIPTDWSIKTRARFTSSLPFTWAAAPRGREEADGLALFTGRPDSSKEVSSTSSSQISRLLSCQMVWMHPSLPFLNLFPRHDTKQIASAAATQSALSILNEQMIDSLRDDWVTSFQSLFQLIQADHCNHFYLCANQFTVLFLSKSASSSHSTTAFLTPTTSGLRQAMSNEGVEFTLPLAGKDKDAVDSDSEMTSEDDVTANSWLHSMGLPLSSTEHSNNGITLQRSRSFSISDNKPASVVKVVGPSVHALFNFLLNCKIIVSTTGVHAGIPPTLISPVPFLGGALRSVRAKQGTAQQIIEGKLTPIHTLDVSGPLLPHTVQQLCSLLRKTQSKHLTAEFSIAESTVAFNNSRERDSVTIRELKCTDGLYTWR